MEKASNRCRGPLVGGWCRWQASRVYGIQTNGEIQRKCDARQDLYGQDWVQSHKVKYLPYKTPCMKLNSKSFPDVTVHLVVAQCSPASLACEGTHTAELAVRSRRSPFAVAATDCCHNSANISRAQGASNPTTKISSSLPCAFPWLHD
jgi:hypothetical protein